MIAQIKNLMALTGCVLVAGIAHVLGGPEYAAMTGILGLGHTSLGGTISNLATDLFSDRNKAGASKAEIEGRKLRNHDLHRLMGHAIELVLEDAASDYARSTKDEVGVKYLERVRKSIEEMWPEHLPGCRYESITGPAISTYFLGSPTQIKKQKTLESSSEWVAKIEQLAESPKTDNEKKKHWSLQRNVCTSATQPQFGRLPSALGKKTILPGLRCNSG